MSDPPPYTGEPTNLRGWDGLGRRRQRDDDSVYGPDDDRLLGALSVEADPRLDGLDVKGQEK
jgi:hypothetical protein